MNDNLQPTLHIDRHIQPSYDYSMNLSLTHWYTLTLKRMNSGRDRQKRYFRQYVLVFSNRVQF